MASFRDGRMAGETVQVAALVGYVFFGLANALAGLLGRALSGAVTVAVNREELFSTESDDMHTSSAMHRMARLRSDIDSAAKSAQNHLNHAYDDVLKTKHSVPADVWKTLYGGLYLSSFNDLKTFREWQKSVHATRTMRNISGCSRVDLAAMRQRWLIPSLIKLEEILSDIRLRHGSLDKQAQTLGPATQPFRSGIAILCERASGTLTELRDGLKRELQDQTDIRRYLRDRLHP